MLCSPFKCRGPKVPKEVPKRPMLDPRGPMDRWHLDKEHLVPCSPFKCRGPKGPREVPNGGVKGVQGDLKGPREVPKGPREVPKAFMKGPRLQTEMSVLAPRNQEFRGSEPMSRKRGLEGFQTKMNE